MGKRWIGLLIILSILTFAFFFPRIMLWIMEKDMEDKVLTYGTGTLLNFDALTLGEKQALLSNPEVTIIEESIPSSIAGNVESMVHVELELLSNCGAITSSTYDFLRIILQDLEIMSCKAYDHNGKNLFYFYSLENENAHLRIDQESKKILSLSAISNQSIEASSESCEVQLRSWAEYFGMSVSDLMINSENPSFEPERLFASCKLTGSADSHFYYSVSLDFQSNSWECCSILPPEE